MRHPRTPHDRVPSAQTGFTLVELMVAMALGLLIVLALITLLVNVNRSNSEMAKTNRQIENGRFAMQLLQSDLVHAGYWGRLGYAAGVNPLPAPTAVPSPCTSSGTWDDTYKKNLLGVPVQGYKDLLNVFPDATTFADCGIANLLTNSDVLVVNHANTCAAGSANCSGGTDTGQHIQVSACRNGVPPEAMFVVALRPTPPASDSLVFPLKGKNCDPGSVAPQFKVISNIYYLALDNGQPTLMRVTLNDGARSTPQALIEGIEAFRVEFGLDSNEDGDVDSFVKCAPCTLAELSNTVAVKVYILARNQLATAGYVDAKSYQLGTTAIAARNDGFKRHVYATTIRLVNPAGRRELPL